MNKVTVKTVADASSVNEQCSFCHKAFSPVVESLNKRISWKKSNSEYVFTAHLLCAYHALLSYKTVKDDGLTNVVDQLTVVKAWTKSSYCRNANCKSYDAYIQCYKCKKSTHLRCVSPNVNDPPSFIFIVDICAKKREFETLEVIRNGIFFMCGLHVNLKTLLSEFDDEIAASAVDGFVRVSSLSMEAKRRISSLFDIEILHSPLPEGYF